MAAAGPFIFPALAKLNFFNTTNLLNANAANFKLALFASTLVPADSTNQVLADLGANELATGNGYTAGGIALTSVALSQTGGVVKFTSAAAVWTASGAGIPAWRYGYVYYVGILNALTNPLVGHFLGDATPADVPLTTSGNTLTVTMNTSGIIAAT